MRSGICFFTIVMVMVHVGVSVFAYDWSSNPGDGSPENPYQISEPNHLMAIGSNAALLDKHFVLTNDIVFDPNNNPEHLFDKALIAPDVNDLITDFQGYSFSGYFDGYGNEISNLVIDANDYSGLFGYIDYGGSVCDLGIKNVSIIGRDYAGSIAGYNTGRNVINCYGTGIISGKSNIGGLIGYQSGHAVYKSYFIGAL